MIMHLPQEDAAEEGPEQVCARGVCFQTLRVKQHLPPPRRSRWPASTLAKRPCLGWIQGCGYWRCHGSTLTTLIRVGNTSGVSPVKYSVFYVYVSRVFFL